MEGKYEGPERREATRFDCKIPVEYNLINDVRSVELSRKRAGIICNISSHGLHLEIPELNDSWTDGLYSGMIKLGLVINLPGEKQPLRAVAKVVWLTKSLRESDSGTIGCILGLEFLDITTTDRDRITNYILNSYLSEQNK